ncbi:MAG TPA: DUF5320 domain-containing protein [Candidatus Methanomethylophilaceae archaeon]|nr:DUF5320 domain-containing protein [Candidatus Methanomethylophilaceae archaeon]
MPRGDRTGPEGQGPMTGRKGGYCSINNEAGTASPGRSMPGRGEGCGKGRGRGMRNERGSGQGFGRGRA